MFIVLQRLVMTGSDSKIGRQEMEFIYIKMAINMLAKWLTELNREQANIDTVLEINIKVKLSFFISLIRTMT